MKRKRTITRKKEQELRKKRAYNANHKNINDERFKTNEFFDPKDLIQARYEMLRAPRVDGVTVNEAAERFGVSRVTYYKLAKAFEEKGIIGLKGHKPGPKGPYKCTNEIVEFVKKIRSQGDEITWESIIEEVKQEFGVELHRRTIERGIARLKKNEKKTTKQTTDTTRR